MKVQRRVDGQWILYAQYMNKGYTKSNTIIYLKKDGTTGTDTQTVWTEAGRLFIHGMIQNEYKRATASFASC